MIDVFFLSESEFQSVVQSSWTKNERCCNFCWDHPYWLPTATQFVSFVMYYLQFFFITMCFCIFFSRVRIALFLLFVLMIKHDCGFFVILYMMFRDGKVWRTLTLYVCSIPVWFSIPFVYCLLSSSTKQSFFLRSGYSTRLQRNHCLQLSEVYAEQGWFGGNQSNWQEEEEKVADR